MIKESSIHQSNPVTLEICEILADGIARHLQQSVQENAVREKDNWTNAGTRACMSHTVQRQESGNEKE